MVESLCSSLPCKMCVLNVELFLFLCHVEIILLPLAFAVSFIRLNRTP